MKIAAPPTTATVPAAAAVPATGIDTELVEGLRLPKVPGLPGSDTPGKSLGDLLGPPKPGSLAAKADMAAVKAAQKLRTPAGDRWADRMAREGATKVWFELARRHRDSSGKVQGWLGTALLAATMASAAAVTQGAKMYYGRPRPYQVDPSIKPPVKLPHSASYPSGHSSSAFAAARVISRLAPELAVEAYSLATQVAVSRVYAGVHYPSDVVAGALLGTGVADAALRVARRDGIDAAIASLKGA